MRRVGRTRGPARPTGPARVRGCSTTSSRCTVRDSICGSVLHTDARRAQAHDAPVLRITWAHPEFGQVLATASMDRQVRVWEEQEHGAPHPSLQAASCPFAGPSAIPSDAWLGNTLVKLRGAEEDAGSGERRWVERSRLTHNRTVHSVQFAPKHAGLKLVRRTCARDGPGRVRAHRGTNAGDMCGGRQRVHLRGCGPDEPVAVEQYRAHALGRPTGSMF
jgi:WD40 repeat protein